MTNDLRIVIDTNVLVSGLFGIKNSPSFQILKAIRSQKVILVASTVIIEELCDVLSRKRIIKLTKMHEEERKNFIEALIERSEVTAGKQLPKIVGRDVKDDKFLACAYEAKADYLVTGDDDLLVLKEYKGIKIVKPRKFVDLFTNISQK
jgi:uncharacterized protein